MDAIRLENIALFAHHGVTPQEQKQGQRFFVDVELTCDLTAAAREDDLSQTIDYEAVYHTVAEAFTDRPYRLLEGAGWAVMTALFQKFPVEQITVRLRKPSAPIDGIFDTVEVELTRQRHEMPRG